MEPNANTTTRKAMLPVPDPSEAGSFILVSNTLHLCFRILFFGLDNTHELT